MIFGLSSTLKMWKYFGSAFGATVFILQPFDQTVAMENMLAWTF